jgi:hypothetical protein
MVALCTRKGTSALAAPMLRVNCPVFSPLPGPHRPFFPPSHPHMRTFTTTDNVNMPESVGHTAINQKPLVRTCYTR